MSQALDRPKAPEFTPDQLAGLLDLHRAVSNHGDRAALLAAASEAIQRLLPAECVVVELAEDRGGAPAAEAGMPSALALPLVVQDRRVGVLRLLAREPGVFAACPPRLLKEVAGSVAAALDHCLAGEQVRRLGQEAQALLDVNAAVARHLQRDELFGAMAVCLRGQVPTDRFGIELPIEGERLQGHLLTPLSAGAEPTRPTLLPAKGTACDWVLRRREWVVVASREELRERFPVTWQVMDEEGMESLCALPLVSGARCPGVLFFMAARPGAYDGLRRGFLEQVAAAVAVALDDCLAHEEVGRLRDRLAAENSYLQEEILQEHHFGEIVGRSVALRNMLAQVERVAPADATALILGETGTGKELVARAIHDRSARRERPLVKVNCAAITAGLVESELFGHVKGAFTGAFAERTGRFELADGGTLFLDEIGELPLETQAKLLRVLQEREFEPVGSSQTRRVDVRVIAATNRDLEQAVAEGRFRSDLYFRVAVLPIRVPPLRERREDVPLLVQYFAERCARPLGRQIDGFSSASLRRLQAYAWPGNVRELQNVVERAVVLAKGPLLELGPEFLPADAVTPGRSLPASASAPPPADVASPGTTLDELSRQHILAVLERCGGIIEGPRGAASALGLRPSTLRSRLKKLGVQARGAPR
jgi:formate hydrogenlyase transcriptional activator